jgi:hypothetical protein
MLPQVAADIAFKKGLKLPMQLLLASCKKRSPEMEVWLNAARSSLGRPHITSICSGSSSRLHLVVLDFNNSYHTVNMLQVDVETASVHWIYCTDQSCASSSTTMAAAVGV